MQFLEMKVDINDIFLIKEVLDIGQSNYMQMISMKENFKKDHHFEQEDRDDCLDQMLEGTDDTKNTRTVVRQLKLVLKKKDDPSVIFGLYKIIKKS